MSDLNNKLCIYELAGQYLDKNLSYLIDLSVEICSIPSMTGNEERKAAFIRDKLLELDVGNISIDEAGNVLYLYNPEQHEKIVVFAAHTDTVFLNLYDITPVIKDNRIYAPSIRDNTVNVAALIFLIRMVKELEIKFDTGILFAFDVGEEGFGNLKGIRHIVDQWGDRICEVIAVDGGYDKIVNAGVGSKRYSVSVKTQGGHSWNDFGNDNAILYAAKIVTEVYRLEMPHGPKTVYNAGLIRGGTSVNTIAEDTEITFDFRSEDMACLLKLEKDFLAILDGLRDEKIGIEAKLLGERPCGKNTEPNALIKRIVEIRAELSMETEFCSGSTDANIPLSIGIPAVSFGIANGEGAHTLNEYLELDSLHMGMKHLVYLLLKY